MALTAQGGSVLVPRMPHAELSQMPHDPHQRRITYSTAPATGILAAGPNANNNTFSAAPSRTLPVKHGQNLQLELTQSQIVQSRRIIQSQVGSTPYGTQSMTHMSQLGKTLAAKPALAVPAVTPNAPPLAFWATPMEAMLICGSVSQWLQPAASRARGLCVARPGLMSRDLYQQAVNNIVDGDEAEPIYREECVELESARTAEGGVSAEAFKQVTTMLDGLDLPDQLVSQIKADAAELCEILSRLFPNAQHACLKLDTFGTSNRCSIWHQDYYTARAFVCYCGAGTEYTEDANVNFHVMDKMVELAKSSYTTEEKNAMIIKSPFAIKLVGVGDMLLMKGNKYPGLSNGLVHKSPEPEFDSDGKVKHRLALKVDISDLKA